MSNFGFPGKFLNGLLLCPVPVGVKVYTTFVVKHITCAVKPFYEVNFLKDLLENCFLLVLDVYNAYLMINFLLAQIQSYTRGNVYKMFFNN